MYALTHTFGKISSFDSNHPTYMKVGKTATVATDVAIATTLFVVAALAFLATDGATISQLSFLGAIGPGGSAVMVVSAASIMGVNHIVFAIDISFPPPQKQVDPLTISVYDPVDDTSFVAFSSPPPVGRAVHFDALNTPGVPQPPHYSGPPRKFSTPDAYPTPFGSSSLPSPIKSRRSSFGRLLFPTPVRKGFKSPHRKQLIHQVKTQSVKLKHVSELPQVQHGELETLGQKLPLPTSRTMIKTAVDEFCEYLREKLFDHEVDFQIQPFEEQLTYKAEDNCLHGFFVRIHSFVYDHETKTFDNERICEALKHIEAEISPAIAKAVGEATANVRGRRDVGSSDQQLAASHERWKEGVKLQISQATTYTLTNTAYDITTFKLEEKSQENLTTLRRIEQETGKTAEQIGALVELIKNTKSRVMAKLNSPAAEHIDLTQFQAKCSELQNTLDKIRLTIGIKLNDCMDVIPEKERVDLF